MRNFFKISLILKIIPIKKLKLNSTLKKFNVEQRVFWIRNYTCYWELHLIKIINDLKNMSYSSKEANMWKVSKTILFNLKKMYSKRI